MTPRTTVTNEVYPLTIYYDASCPLCNGEMTNLKLRDTGRRLILVDASAPGFASPLPGTTPEDLMRLIHARRADGQVLRSVEVFRLAYEAVGLGWVTAATRWPVLGPLADRLYPWIARHRQRLPRRLVRWLFEGPTRRAAESASRRARCDDGTCTR